MKILRSLIVFFILLASISFQTSCSLLKPTQVKQAEKEAKAKLKESEEAYELLKEEHMARQSELTRERMEMTKKRSEYYNRSKERPGFFKRIFGKRKKK